MKLTVITIVLLSSLSLVAQTPASTATAKCELTLEKSPTIRGLKLGMTKTALIALFGQPHPNIVEPEVFIYAPFPQKHLAKTLSGIESIHISFYDDRISTIKINYAFGTNWKDAREFTDVISEPLSVPVNAWVHDGSMNGKMICDGFTLKTKVVVAPTLELFDDIAEKQKLDDKENETSQKKKAFKP